MSRESDWSLYDHTKAPAIAEEFDAIAEREYWYARNAAKPRTPVVVLPVVDLSNLCHAEATMEYLAILGEPLNIVGYDDGKNLHRELQKRGDEPLARVWAPRNRGSYTNSPDGEPLP